MSNIVKKVVLQLGKKEVELTLDEAKKLYEGLSELFEQKVVVQHHYSNPWWTWSYPAVPVYTNPIVTCGSSNYLASSGVSFSVDSSQTLLCSVNKSE